MKKFILFAGVSTFLLAGAAGAQEYDNDFSHDVEAPSAAGDIDLQDMTLDHGSLEIEAALGEVNRELDRVMGAAPGLSDPDLSGYRSEIDEMAATQRRIRLLELKLTEAQLATSLWQLVFGNWEKRFADKAADSPVSSSTGGFVPEPDSSTGGRPSQIAEFDHSSYETVYDSLEEVPGVSIPDFDDDDGAGLDVSSPTYEEELASQAEESLIDSGGFHSALSSFGGNSGSSSASGTTAPRPLVSSIIGSGGSIKAVLLVPYVGEMTVRAGQELPNGLKITSITADGVIAKSGSDTFKLGYGDEVPLFGN